MPIFIKLIPASDIFFPIFLPYLNYLTFNSFATSDAYMRQLFHHLQWYAGSERVNVLYEFFNTGICAFDTCK